MGHDTGMLKSPAQRCCPTAGTAAAALSSLTRAASVLILLTTGLLVGCASLIQPDPLAFPDALSNLQRKEVGEVVVEVGILSDEQAMQHFGIDLGEEDIQPIWLRVHNRSAVKLWFVRNALDKDFYSADEVAQVMISAIPKDQRDEVRQSLRDQSMRVAIEPGTELSGFIFAPKAIGGRYVDVRLLEDVYTLQLAREAARDQEAPEPEVGMYDLRFGFAIPLPDGIFDYERLDPQKTYGGRELPNLSQSDFRSALEALPCCARNKKGTGDGDPLNLVIVAPAGAALNTLSRAGWSFTHRISLESILQYAGAALQGESYPVAPVSDLFVFDRKQDFALQRARPNISQRNHLRVWMAPFRFRNLPVWVGQISRDIGIKLTPNAPTLTTHVIDPSVDLTREYFLHGLLAEGFVDSFGFVGGSRAATRENPATNLTGDPYFSDGKRLVVVLSPDPVSYAEVKSLLWERSAAPVAQGQTENAGKSIRKISGKRQ